MRDWGERALYDDGADEKAVAVKLIPYFSFANRGQTDMIIWVLRR
jgi:DUF1680 family protein